MPPLTVSGTSSINVNSLSLTQNPSLSHLNLFNSRTSFPFSSRVPTHDSLSSPLLSSSSGLCRASQLAELFPTMSPDIVVREARLEDCWEVAETHCSSFFPEYSFPLDFALRIDRLIGMLFGFSVPSGCQRTCLVAVIGSSDEDVPPFWNEDFKIGGFDGKFSLNKRYVAGILTVDTVADFLPRKGHLRQRRKGIAYISNVAVRERFRRKGIAKRLITKAEAQARSWGCRAIALHCDLNNPGATKLYRDKGFKCIKVPEAANWPQPRTSPDVQFHFMMKLLKPLGKSSWMEKPNMLLLGAVCALEKALGTKTDVQIPIAIEDVFFAEFIKEVQVFLQQSAERQTFDILYYSTSLEASYRPVLPSY